MSTNQTDGQPEFSSIAELLEAQSRRHGDRTAIVGADQPPLSYHGLWQQFRDTVHVLRTFGVESKDRVAIVLPNGPEMALAFLSVSGAATAAPLNPAYCEQEFDFYLTDLNPRVLIVDTNADSVVREVARRRKIPVVELAHKNGAPAGTFVLSGSPHFDKGRAEFTCPEDVALVLHTSGTTSRPKMVPLTQRNVSVSARNICKSLALSSADRCLNVMPLFHIHGLVAAVLSSLSAGGSIVCSSGFDVQTFWNYLAQLRPTWYTAVPTMHQAVLSTADAHANLLKDHGLRFIRSCSSALPPTVMAKLEETFSVPVVEAYGMTEAAHQMTCNPLPPAARKPASVGVATGLDVAVMDEAGRVLPAGSTGEVVIRGDNVTHGYANNPEANESALDGGWFRTGDRGHFDDEGYLFLTGRLKEMINRGGENISPREIDEVLMEHSDVSQALAFAVPHPTLGESVAAVVVSRAGSNPSEQELRDFAAQCLSDFKVPQQIIFLDAIPKGPTGKPQRIGLAEKLGLADSGARDDDTSAKPQSQTEEQLAAIWAEILARPSVKRTDQFLQTGGDSLRAMQMIQSVRNAFAVELPMAWVFECPTLAELAERIDGLITNEGTETTDQLERRKAG